MIGSKPRQLIDRCATCRFWPARVDWSYVDEGEEPRISGEKGPHTDGSASDCRRHAPTFRHEDGRVSATAIWPTTAPRDWCGDYEVAPDRVVNPNKREKISRNTLAWPGYLT